MNDTSPTSETDGAADDCHDELVAYLDGEVTASERERIEGRLTDDEAYRSKLVELERSWRLLDRLPTAGEDKDLTRSTIAMVAAELQNPSTALDTPPSGPGRKAPWGKLVAAIAAGLIGFLAVFMPGRGQQHRELRDMPLAENLELYKVVESVEVVKLLRDKGLFVQSDDSDENEANSATSWSESKDPSVIRAGIGRLTAEDKQKLLTRLDRFHELSFEEKDRMHELQRQMVEDSDSATLFRVVKGYRKFLATLTAAERADLRDIKEPAERVAATSELHKTKVATWINPNDSKFAVTKEELEAYYLELPSADRDELRQLPPNEMQERLKRWYLEENSSSIP